MVSNQRKIIQLAEFRELYNPKWRNIIYYGGRASGKSQHVAMALLIRGEQKKLRILCTREMQVTIRDSVHKLLKDLISKYSLNNYVVTENSVINAKTGTEFLFKGLKYDPNGIKSTEGIDICWVEEAQSVSEASLDILAPTIRKAGSQLIFTFNRFNELDPVYVKYVMNKPPHTYALKVNYDALQRAGLLPEVIEMEIEADRNDPSLFAHKWLGEPIEQSDRAIIGREKVLNAMNRTIPDDGQIEIGVDVARMGDDRTVFWKRKGLKTTDTRRLTKHRTPEICDMLEQFTEFNHSIVIKVDDTGVGGGVTDEMIKRGYNIVPINFGGVAVDTDKYPNWISEAWFYFESILDKADLPMDSDLLMELSTRCWAQDAKGKRRIEGKQDYKKRGFRSPDLADACIICYSVPNVLGVDDFSL